MLVEWQAVSHKQETLRKINTLSANEFSVPGQLIEILPRICFYFTGRYLLI